MVVVLVPDRQSLSGGESLAHRKHASALQAVAEFAGGSTGYVQKFYRH